MSTKFFRKNNAHSRLFDKSYFSETGVLHLEFAGKKSTITALTDGTFLSEGEDWTSTTTTVKAAMRDCFYASGGIGLEGFSLHFDDAVKTGFGGPEDLSYLIEIEKGVQRSVVTIDYNGRSAGFPGYFGETKYLAARWLSLEMIKDKELKHGNNA